MRSSVRGLLLLCVLGASGLQGCGDAAPDGEEADELARFLEPGLARGTRVLLIDTLDEVALWFEADREPGAADAEPERVGLAAGPVLAVARDAHPDDAWVLADGLRGVEQVPTLSRVTASGELQPFALGAEFDSVTQDPAGRFAVAHHRRGSDQLVFGAQQVAIVDADQPRVQALARTLSTPAGVPGLLAVSPALQLAGADAQVLVVGSPGYLTLLGLGDADARETLVQLTSLTRDPLPEPVQVLFDADAARAYARLADADDLFVLDFAPPATDEATPAVALRQLPAGEGPSDMLLLGPAAGRRLALLTDGGDSLWLFDGDDPEPLRLPLVAPSTRLLGAAPDDDGDPRELLLYAPGSPWVSFVAFDADGQPLLDSVRLQAPVQEVIELAAQRRALLVHDQTLISVLDLATRRSFLANLRTGLQAAVWDEALPALWLGAPGQYLVAALDLASGESREVLLEQPVAQIVLVPDAARAAVVHPDGTLTLLDALKPALDESAGLGALSR